MPIYNHPRWTQDDLDEGNRLLEKYHPYIKKNKQTRICKKCTHWLITINSATNDILIFKKAIEDLIKIPWISKFYVFVYELGNKNGGLHIHLLAINNQNRKGRSLEQMYQRVRHVVLNKSCIQLDQVFDSKISNVLKYFEKIDHPDQQLLNNEYRRINHLQSIYRSSKLL